jgi:hypothetical protein
VTNRKVFKLKIFRGFMEKERLREIIEEDRCLYAEDFGRNKREPYRCANKGICQFKTNLFDGKDYCGNCGIAPEN